jgi:hypothetical protein
VTGEGDILDAWSFEAACPKSFETFRWKRGDGRLRQSESSF